MSDDIFYSSEEELFSSVGEDVDLGWIGPYDLLMQRLSACILRGDGESARELLASVPAGSPTLVRLGPTPVRSTRNLYIILLHRAAAAARQAGLPRAIVIRLEERYILRIEEASDPRDLRGVFLDAVLDLCRRSRSYDTPQPSDRLILKAVRFINDNSTGKLSLRTVAEHLSVSPEHLSRRFREETGKAVTAYIRESKVLLACSLLKNTKESLAEISGNLSFSSQSYFQKVFRDTTGMTPNEFRKRGLL